MPRAPRSNNPSTKPEVRPMTEPKTDPAAPSAAQPRPAAPAASAPKTFSPEEVEKMIAEASAKSSEKAQSALLAKLGAKSPDELAAALGKYRDAEEAQKSELQKLMERATKFEAEASGAKLYREKLAAIMQRELDGLTPAQKAAVERFGGDDPLKIAEALDFLRPTWQGAPPAPTPAAQAGAQSASSGAPAAKPAAPANAALPVGAPTPSPVKTKWEEFDAIRNPIAKNVFYSVHSKEIEATRPPPPAN